jgi:hypothetical protein
VPAERAGAVVGVGVGWVEYAGAAGTAEVRVNEVGAVAATLVPFRPSIAAACVMPGAAELVADAPGAVVGRRAGVGGAQLDLRQGDVAVERRAAERLLEVDRGAERGDRRAQDRRALRGVGVAWHLVLLPYGTRATANG